MAIAGLFTTLGLSKTIHADSNQGFKIHPESFGVSRNVASLNKERTGANAGQWFTAPVSSRVVVDQNTIKFICTVPPESSLVKEDIKEVCLFAKDGDGVEFMLAVGQPTEEIVYDPTGTITLELQVSLADVDLTSIYVFNNTKAVELEGHATDPNAHPEVMETLAKYGITLEAGAYPKTRMGQYIEFPVEFDGTKAAFTHSGVTFTAKYNGTELNGKTIVFDGSKSVDQIRADFNAINYPNTVEHNGTGTEVLPASTKTLSGGTYIVAEKDVVYKDVDGVYKRALADGSPKSRIAGWAKRSEKIVVGQGFADIDTGYPANTPIYLSGTTAGKITNFNTNISIGVSLGDHIYFTGYAGDVSTNVAQEFDAVVTDAAGVGQFPTTQQAIDFVPNNGRILVKKMELVKETIESTNKNLTIVLNDADSGWKRFLGQATIFHIGFSQVPTQGTWRIEWEGQETNDMPWNASASLVQTEFNQLDGHNGFTVAGNFTDGFTFTSDDLQVYTLPTFVYVGRNEIQRFEFSAVPDNGTVRFKFNGQETVNYAFNDSLTQLQQIFDDLSSTINVELTGSFASGFNIEFKGGWLQDGNKEQNLVQAVTDFLYSNGVQVDINGSHTLPINSTVVQKGKTPAANLYIGTDLIDLSVTMLQTGEEVGPDRLMNVNSPILSVTGFGLIDDFREGLVIKSGNNVLQFQARINNTDKPLLTLDKLPTANYDIELPDFAKDIFAELRLTEHPTNKKRAVVSGMDWKLPSGITLSKSLDSLKARFAGAEIDFSLGKVYDADGVTDIGIDFVAPVITPTKWKWYSVNLIISASDPVTNETLCNILVLPAQSEGTTKELAPKAPVDDNPIGQVALRGALGEKEKTIITTIKDAFATPLEGKCFKLYHPTQSVAFFFEDPANTSFIPALALTADRYVKMTTLVNNDFQATVANKIKAYIDADPLFVATVVGNKVTVENTVLGAVTEADMGDTGFFKNIIVKGTNTDATGIDDVSNYNIVQFSTGSGSGAGGVGVGDIFIQDLKSVLDKSYYGYLDTNVFQKNKEKKLSVQGGSYVTTKKHWKLDAGQSFVSIDHIDPDFKSELIDLDKIRLILNYTYDAQDSAPVVEASRDGGTNYQVIPMSTNASGLRTGELQFGAESVLTLIGEHAVSNADSVLAFNNTTRLERAQEFVTHATKTTVLTKLTSYFNKVGSPVGTFQARIVKDNGSGLPSNSPADVMWISSAKAISGLAIGDNTVVFDTGVLVLAPNTKYHIVYFTDTAYKTSWVTGTTELSLRADGSSPAFPVVRSWTGSAWVSSTMASVYKMEGRYLDLRIRITSATNGSGIIGYGVLYGYAEIPAAKLTRDIEIHHFSGDLNKSVFTLTEIVPHPEFLEACLIQTGQVWKYPAFEIQGQNVVFPDLSFKVAGQVLTIRFDQTKGGSYDNSDRNLSLLTENHLGSQSPSLDKSVPGRGIFLRRPDGTLREICLADDDSFVIYST